MAKPMRAHSRTNCASAILCLQSVSPHVATGSADSTALVSLPRQLVVERRCVGACELVSRLAVADSLFLLQLPRTLGASSKNDSPRVNFVETASPFIPGGRRPVNNESYARAIWAQY